MTITQKEQLSAKTKIQWLEEKTRKRQLTTVPIQYDDQLQNLSRTIEANLITSSSSTVTSLSRVSTISELGMLSYKSTIIDDNKLFKFLTELLSITKNV